MNRRNATWMIADRRTRWKSVNQQQQQQQKLTKQNK